jgi:Asp-tRNA(Asn)/Glu-tRNA(Gln) amidotransferase A subunit family amidase
LSVIAGYEPRKPFSVAGQALYFQAALTGGPGLRIVFSPALGWGRVDGEVARLTAQAIQALQDAGHHVDQIEHCFDDPIAIWTGLPRTP